jgi:hypothetical protein
LGLLDAFSIEPQVGYSYGTYSNDLYKYSPSDVSGLTYGFKAGFTILHGLEVYGLLQSTSTKVFGSTFDYGAGMEVRF